MSLWQRILRSLGLRKISTTMTALNVALGVMLVAAILSLAHQVSVNYRNQGSGFPIVLGSPKGSGLDLVLNTVYHLGTSPGNMPFRVYTELMGEKAVKLAIPYAVGDSFRGYRVIGTTDAIFNDVFRPLPDRPLRVREGRPFAFDAHRLEHAIEEVESLRPASAPADDDHGHGHDHEPPAEAVIGSDVARALGLKVGDKIEPTHGVEGGKQHEHEHLWDLVGILEPTGTTLDRVVFINLDSFYEIPEHQKGARLSETGEAGLSATIVYPQGGVWKGVLLGRLKKRTDIQVANPSEEIRKLLDTVGDTYSLFLFVAVLVVIVGVSSVAVALYNTMNERRREIAILRAIGAGRRTVVAQIVGEATLISILGCVGGIFLSRVLLIWMRDLVAARSGFTPDAGWATPFPPGAEHPLPWFVSTESVILFGVAVVGALAGLLPAIKGYRTDVATNLAPSS